jgi:hypothetical protein
MKLDFGAAASEQKKRCLRSSLPDVVCFNRPRQLGSCYRPTTYYLVQRTHYDEIDPVNFSSILVDT